MRTEQREHIIKDRYTVYIAEDGTEFRNENECKEYEQTAKAVINAAFERTKFGNEIGCAGEDLLAFGFDETLFCVHITDENDLHDVNMWLKYNDAKTFLDLEQAHLGHDAIGTIQVIGDNGYGDIFFYGSIEALKDFLHQQADALIEQLIEPKFYQEKDFCKATKEEK